jgi:UDP-glucose 4-epimerase
MKRCLITGATGAVGPRLVAALRREGWTIRALSRTASRDTSEPSTEIIEGDVTDSSAVKRAVMGVDTVFHLAALLHVVDPPPALSAEYHRVNVGATGSVMEAARDAGVGRVVFFSTIAVYGYSRREPFSENGACEPDTFYARTKLEAENLVLAARRSDGGPLGTILRLAAVYGPGIKGNYERLARAVARGRFVGIGSGENRRALIHDHDVARAALIAAAHPAAAGRVFNVSDGQGYRMRDIIEAIATAAGRRRPRAHVPLPVARGLASLVEHASRRAGLTPPVTRAAIDKYTEEVLVDASRIRHELGFEARTGLAEGWRDAVEGLRARGVI